jgi:site-specific recombinase XerD
MLRHSAATFLLNQGMSLPGVGALLRHQHLDTTMIYAKVDVSLLGSVSQPWSMEVSR